MVDGRPELAVQAADAVACVLFSGILNNDYKPGHLYAKEDPLTGSWRCELHDVDVP